MNVTVGILNLKIIIKENITTTASAMSLDLLNEYKLDMLSLTITGSYYLISFVIPADDTPKAYLAYVLIIPISRIGVFFKILHNFIIIFGIMSSLLYLFNYLQTDNEKNIGLFNFVRLLLA